MARSLGLNIYRAYKGWNGSSRAEKLLAREIEAGKEHPLRARERLGEITTPRPAGPLVWFHASNETDALAIPELVARLAAERDEVSFLITTSVYEPDMPLEGRLSQPLLHQYLPYETGKGIKRFLDHWRPDVVVWSDRDLRPTVLENVSERKVPLIMIDAHVPEDAQKKWRWYPGTAKQLVRRFDGILAGDQRSAENLRNLGVAPEKIEVVGYLQEGTAPLSCSQTERDAMGELLAARPVWLAAGIDAREEDIVVAAHRQAIRRSHRLLLILVPHDKSRGPDIAERLEAEGWAVALRSREEEPETDVQIFIADVPQEMGLWFRLAPTSFMGQSLAEGPGRNPYEATALGSALLYGPNVHKYRESYERLNSAGAAVMVHDVQSLGRQVEYFLAPDKAAEMAAAAWEVSTSGAEVTDRASDLIFAALDARGV